MTEKQWLKCAEPELMSELLKAKLSERKSRLLACAICRDMGKKIKDERYWKMIDTGELWADEGNQPPEAEEVWETGFNLYDEAQAAGDFNTHIAALYTTCCVEPDPLHLFFQPPKPEQQGWRRVLKISSEIVDRVLGDGTEGQVQVQKERRTWCCYAREVLGNPFRPITFSPSWRTSTAVALAAQMYESRDFSAMPILADALQDAGCENTDILNHCRGPGSHVRGCWVVDLVLEKE
ncbi:hypothetical protein VT84_10090 [Gemmata sp. SH-PL17]|uniref:hypothetical protein n=1 Tax=Gemmata sp. SH-PL17 TaxID=1630693 RepID=UPI00078CFF06|nr:hypothetical protein [Gemmata sp. SH-PL17]AMV24735.1 hypothetical protein VT84_10090 [Gemmata sp. SH-PL17]